MIHWRPSLARPPPISNTDLGHYLSFGGGFRVWRHTAKGGVKGYPLLPYRRNSPHIRYVFQGVRDVTSTPLEMESLG